MTWLSRQKRREKKRKQACRSQERHGLYDMRKHKKKKLKLAGLFVLVSLLAGCGQKTLSADGETLSSAQKESGTDRTESTKGEALLPLQGYDSEDKDYSVPEGYITRREGKSYGERTTIEYFSEATGTARVADVLLPADYDETRKYPVVYLLHGMGAAHNAWGDLGAIEIAQNLFYDGEAPEMIFVCPDTMVVSSGAESEMEIREIVAGYDAVTEDLVKALMPYVNEHFNVLTGRAYTAIAGYSMGGREALYAAFTYPELFGYIGSFSGASSVIPESASRGMLKPMLEKFSIQPQIGDFHLILINSGWQDDLCGQATTVYHEAMEREGIPHVYYRMEGGHEPAVWQNGLYHFIKRLF